MFQVGLQAINRFLWKHNLPKRKNNYNKTIIIGKENGKGGSECKWKVTTCQLISWISPTDAFALSEGIRI
ncbi:hypothetical protein MYP_3967 [Sporocytophaga myxococcoides]|uniref:Uncharacterized protein n=1 Tax=Sporocytophaga myxococcoides TaxID=153721 RepID=A0A098LKB5_9BACT|nr:hypothetical protein MYP_3967 [Sporocytophaga myxococcoides]